MVEQEMGRGCCKLAAIRIWEDLDLFYYGYIFCDLLVSKRINTDS